MTLDQYVKIAQGIPSGRIPSRTSTTEEVLKISMFTVQDLDISPEVEHLSEDKEEARYFYIQKDKIRTLPITKEGMVVVSLMARKAKIITKEEIDKIIPSNFAVIQSSSLIDSWFIEWYLNEHPTVQRYINTVKQGSAIRPLTVNLLKKIPIKPPSIRIQELIGKIYQLQKEKHQLQQEKISLEKLVLTYSFLKKMEEI